MRHEPCHTPHPMDTWRAAVWAHAGVCASRGGLQGWWTAREERYVGMVNARRVDWKGDVHAQLARLLQAFNPRSVRLGPL